MKTKLFIVLALLMSFTPIAKADITDARITELWVGRSGPDGTRDWLEVTNTGDTPIMTGDLGYDDSSPMLVTALILPNYELLPGESAVFLIDVDADNPTMFANAGIEFLSVWMPFDAPLDGGQADGGLSQNGDAANLLDAATGDLIDSFTYISDDTADQATMERIGEGDTDIRASVLGENGAFEAQTFIDEATGVEAVDSSGNTVVLVGSPGVFNGFAKITLGDVNCDGAVDLLDVQPFVALITNGAFSSKADINEDGTVDLLDVGPFVDLLSGP